MNGKEVFLAQQEAELRLWNDEIWRLEAQARHVQPAKRRGCVQLLAFLGKMRLQAQEKLEVLETTRDDAWEEIKLSLEELWQDLHEGARLADSYFRNVANHHPQMLQDTHLVS